MNSRQPVGADSSSLLNSLLGQAFECAIAQRRHEITEILLLALEAHAKETGDETTLDAAYLRGIRTVTASPPGFTVNNPRRGLWRPRS